MGILGAVKVLTQAKPILDYVFKDNNLDKATEQILREIKVLKKEVKRLNNIAEEQRKTILDLITITHPLTIEKDAKNKMIKNFSRGDKK